MADEFKDAYLLCCNACEVVPRQTLLDQLELAIRENIAVESLKLNGNSREAFNNKLTDNEVQAIVETIQCVHGVQILELDLSFNLITDAGARLISDMIQVFFAVLQVSLFKIRLSRAVIHLHVAYKSLTFGEMTLALLVAQK